MNKLIATLACAFALNAGAATQYVDKPFPVPVSAGAPCFVLFDGYYLNVNYIATVAVGNWRKSVPNDDGNPFSSVFKSVEYDALRVTLATGAKYEVTKGDLKAQQAALLKQIKDCE